MSLLSPLPWFETASQKLHEELVTKYGDGQRPRVQRMAKMGRVTPDMWMLQATGMPVGAEALLSATEQALEKSSASNLIGKK
jgi:hypothetical protein